MAIHDYFVLPGQMRPAQEKLLGFIERAVGLGYPHIVVQAPTGGGKSAILATVAEWARHALPPQTYSGGYYLTGQKLLQDQLEHDVGVFKTSMASLKSATEYPCVTKKTCALGLESKNNRCHCAACPYKEAKSRFHASTVAVTNYAYFFTARDADAGSMPQRQVLLADECHQLERLVLGFVELGLSDASLPDYCPDLEELPDLPTKQDFISFLEKEYVPRVQEHVLLLIEVADGSPDSTAARLLNTAKQHMQKAEKALALLKQDPSSWVYWQSRSEDGRREVTARPLYAGPFVPGLLCGASPLNVYATAFLGPKEVWCRSLGLNPDDVAVASVGSDFPVKNRPVRLYRIGSMSKRNVESTWPRAAKFLVKIANSHKDHKGVIHTHSYALAREVVKTLSDAGFGDRIIFPANADARDEAFQKHCDLVDPTILVTPSMAEGFDFKDERARWQVVIKTPYLYLGDAQVAARADEDQQWYDLEAIKTFLQMCGRAVRSKDDWAVTYVLDADFDRLLRKSGHMLPRWLSEAIETKF